MSTPLVNQVIDSEEHGLSFEGNGTTWNTAEDVKNVVTALGEQNIVHYLEMRGNALGVSAAEAIGKAMEKHPEFRKALWKDMFTGRLTVEVPLVLKHLSEGLIKATAHLTVLDLSDNSIGVFGMTGLEEFLWSPVCYTLQELHVNNCDLGILGGRMLSSAVRNCRENSIKNKTPLQLKVFIAGGNNFENEGIKAISEMLRDLRTLEVIALPKNSIHQPGIKILSESISYNRNLRVLNLNNNIITSEGASYLTKAVSSTLLLQELHLSDCKLKADEIISLAKVLDENHLHLEVLNLSSNDINKNGAIVVAMAMKNKPNLKKLMLNGNKFGSDGVHNIAQEMQSAINPGASIDMLDNQSECDDNDTTRAYSAKNGCDNCVNSHEIVASDYNDVTTCDACPGAGPSGTTIDACSNNTKHKAVKGVENIEFDTKETAYTNI